MLNDHLAHVGHLRIAMYSLDFNSFYTHLLPALERANHTFVLVTSTEDTSLPWEEFSCRGPYRHPAAGRQKLTPGQSLRIFLRHPLLLHWYTQNWDLARSAGKRQHFSTRKVDEMACAQRIAIDPSFDSDIMAHGADADLFNKVSPLPIGIGADPSACGNLGSFRALASKAPPLTDRTLAVLAGFYPTRLRELRNLALLELSHSKANHEANATHEHILTPHHGYSHADVLRFSFVAAPTSRGQDTFRFWETISLGAIPIVLAGPLDSFYVHLPCVIVDSWANITPGKLIEWRRHIVHAFGPRPFLHPHVARLLNSSFYAHRMERAEAVLPLRALRNTPRAIVNHTCNLSLGGAMATSLAGNPRRRAALGCL